MAHVRDRWARLRGLRFHYLDRGAAGAPPLLMLHGGAQTAHSFDEVAPPLAARHHVVCFEQRGHGDTSWAAQYRREDFVGDIEAMLDHLGWERAAIVGMSLGGLNAMTFTARRPERVTALVVVDVVPSVAPEGRESITRQLVVREFPSLEDAVAQAHAFNPQRTVENLRERLGHAMRECPDGRWRYKFDPNVADGTRDLERVWAELPRIACPTLLLRGGASPMVSDDAAARFLRAVRGSRVAVIPRAGHSIMGDDPAGFLAEVAPFLARCGR